MAERKVLQKYFPPDFDPSLIKRRKMGKDRQQVVRLMAPFSMRCATCGEYIYKGKKFNARKETVDGEEYYGIKIFRFYIKCTQCSAEITFKTDPKNSDYLAEHGAARNFEPWRDTGGEEEEDDEARLNRLEEEENNPMEKLEMKAMDSKREMDILDALQDLKTRNARIERKGKEMEDDGEKILQRVSASVEVGDRGLGRKLDEYERQRLREQEEDEEEIRKVFGRTHVLGVPDIELDNPLSSSEEEEDSPRTPKDDSPIASGSGSAPSTTATTSMASIKRKLDAVEPTPASLLSAQSRSIIGKNTAPVKKKVKGNSALAEKLGIKLKK